GLAKSQTNPDRLCLNAERSNVSASFAALPLRPLRFQPIKAASSLPYTFRIGFNAKTAKTFAKIAKTLPRILPLCVLCRLRFANFAFSVGRMLVTLCTLRVGSKTKNATIFAKTAKNPPKTPAKLKLSKTKVNLVDHNKDIYPSSPLEAQTAQNAQNPQN